MGKQDLMSKRYMSDNDKFADVFNYYLYNGEQIIKAENLTEKSVSEMIMPLNSSKTNNSLEKYRDILKKCVIKSDSSYTYFLLGIENQSEVHYAMPVRNMLYDSLNYSGQINKIEKEHKKNKDKMNSAEYLSGVTKADKILPVITLVIYWGNNVWDGPRSLFEMFDDTSKNILQFVSNYEINLIEPRVIEDFSLFQTELGKVLEFINASDSIEKMKQVLEKNRNYYLHMDIESAKMIETFGKTKIDTEKYEEEQEVNMCKAIDDMILEGKQEAKLEDLQASVKMAKALGASKEMTVEQLEDKFQLTKEEALELVNKYYN